MKKWIHKYRWSEQLALYTLMLPALLHMGIFGYGPLYGLQIAFKDFRARKGIWGSPWVGLKHFTRFFEYRDFPNLIANTVTISLYTLSTFLIPVLCALMVNEIRSRRAKKLVQTITYAPHFISTVVLCSMLLLFLNRSNGLINNAIAALGGTRIDFLTQPQMFSSIFVWSDVWQNTGWNMIVYLAALSSVSLDCIEAAKIDGANRLQIIRYVNLPHILPTVVIMFILSSGKLLSVGYEKIMLLQNPLNLSTSTVISAYVYEVGLVGGQYSYSTAIGLFNTVINVLMLMLVNTISRKLTQSSLW